MNHDIDLAAVFGPEYEPFCNGDPFIREIVTADDAIGDVEHDEQNGAAMIAHIERWRLSYELETLFRWWNARA